MVSAVNPSRIRGFFGLVTLVLGVFAVILSVSLGISGLVMHFAYGDLIMLGNPAAGPRVTLTLIVEGFLLELGLAWCIVFFGYVVKGNLAPSLNVLKKAKSKLLPGARVESDEESLQESPRKEEKPRPRLEKLKRDFEAKAPKCLWISLLLLAGVNLGLSLTCYVLAGGDGPSGLGLAMRHYGTDPAARQALDWVQQAGECCGEQVYTDWLNVQWCTERPNLVPAEVGPPGYINVCGPKHRSVKNDVPSSCCTPPRSPCIHDPLDLLGLGPLHNDGCSQFIEDQLDPKYMTTSKFHLFLGVYKLLLVGLVLILRTKDDPPIERATDEEAKQLLDDADTGKTPEAERGLLTKPSTKSWFPSLGNKPKPSAPSEGPNTEGEQEGLKKKESKKTWLSAIKFTDPLRKKSKVVAGAESKAEQPEALEMERVGAEVEPGPLSQRPSSAAPPELLGEARAPSPPRTARPVSMEMKGRGLELRSSTVSRARSMESGAVSPRPAVRGSFSEWRRPSTGSRTDPVFGGAAAQIMPSSHEEHRLSAGAVH